LLGKLGLEDVDEFAVEADANNAIASAAGERRAEIARRRPRWNESSLAEPSNDRGRVLPRDTERGTKQHNRDDEGDEARHASHQPTSGVDARAPAGEKPGRRSASLTH
jgi:hypothetical protein